MTGVLNESSLPTGKEQEELVDLWVVRLWMCGGCCQLRPPAEPQVTGILLSSSPEQHQLCCALPGTSGQPKAVCKHKMQVLGSALLMVLFLQGGRMWSC